MENKIKLEQSTGLARIPLAGGPQVLGDCKSSFPFSNFFGLFAAQKLLKMALFGEFQGPKSLPSDFHFFIGYFFDELAHPDDKIGRTGPVSEINQHRDSSISRPSGRQSMGSRKSTDSFSENQSIESHEKVDVLLSISVLISSTYDF